MLANSAGTEERARALGAANTRVVHLGTDVPPTPLPEPPRADDPHRRPPRRPQAPRRRPARAVAAARRPPRPALGRGRRRPGAAGARAAWRRSSASTRRVEFTGELPPDQVRQPATVFALPSVDEAFGVAYVEAMAAGIPAIGCRGEAGPEEIRASGGGIRLVAPGDPESLAEELRRAARGRRLAARARRGGARDRRALVHVGGVRPRDGRRLRGGAAVKPVLFVTNHAPPFRVGAFAKLHEREDVVFALIGGDVRHGGGAGEEQDLPFPVIRPRQQDVARLAGDYRAVVAGLSGRVAPARRLPRRPPGARAVRAVGDRCGRTRGRSRTPPRTCRCATCTATPTRSSPTGRTSRRMCARKARRRPSSRPHRASTTGIGTDNLTPIRRAAFQAAFVGRIAGEKGPQVLIQAWSSSGLSALSAALVLVGGGPIRARAVATGAVLPEGPSARRPKYATSTREATLSSYRRSRPATSASPGGWWSTKPSTRESP